MCWAQHSARPPADLTRLSWEGGVGLWGGCLLIGSKHCQHCFVSFFPWEWGAGGRALLCSWLLAQKASQETCCSSPPSGDPLNTISGYSALLFRTPAVIYRVKGQSRCLREFPKDIKGNVHVCICSSPRCP